jgi:DNA-directed RNA polymerase subunit F
VALEWEVLRWRRLKFNLVRARRLKALEDFLFEKLEYSLYRKRFATELTIVIRDNLAEDQTENLAQTLARKYARNEPDAVEKVDEILASIDLKTAEILHRAKACKAEELAHKYARCEPRTVKLINKLLARESVNIEALTVEALAEDLDYIERIDRLTTVAEGRRNACLREIDRRRAVLGETLRRNLQQIEDRECEVIEATPAIGEDAA